MTTSRKPRASRAAPASASTALPAADSSPEHLRAFSRSLPMALLRAREAVMARFRPMLREHDLSEQQWRVLRALDAATEPLQPSLLAQLSFISMPSLSRLLKTLEARRLIQRSAHAQDLRAAQLSITKKGRNLVAVIAPESEARYAEITARLGEVELEQLYGLLEAVVGKLGNASVVPEDATDRTAFNG